MSNFRKEPLGSLLPDLPLLHGGHTRVQNGGQHRLAEVQLLELPAVQPIREALPAPSATAAIPSPDCAAETDPEVAPQIFFCTKLNPQYTEAEIRAAVEAGENWGTYVTVHAYTPRAIRQAVAAGVKCIDHGQLIDKPTAKLLADKGIWWSLQPFLDDEDASPTPDPVSRRKALEVFAGTDNAYKLAKKYKIKTAFGSDALFDARVASRQGARLAKLVRWYTPAEALKMATADNGELMALTGFINPYPGKLGVVEEGALADLLLVDGNPLENIKLIENPDKNIRLIMKDGSIYKNTLPK